MILLIERRKVQHYCVTLLVRITPKSKQRDCELSSQRDSGLSLHRDCGLPLIADDEVVEQQEIITCFLSWHQDGHLGSSENLPCR